jgi:tetratricopeptide (TPR) repeat protein
MAARTSPWWPLSVAVVAVLVHWPATSCGFVLDDVRLVEHNADIVALSNVPELFLQPYWNVPGEHYGLYRPLTIVSFALNRAILGEGPFGFHLVNVLLHACVSALAWIALRGSGSRYGAALLGGLVFAVLPIHTEAIVGIAGRAELLAALFVLAAWLAHRRAWRAAASLLYLGAILSKESALLAPVLFFADDVLRETRAPFRRGAALAGYAIAAGAMLALRVLALGPHQTASAMIPLDNPAAAAGSMARIATALFVQLRYAALCVAPRQLVADYSFDAIPVVRSLIEPRALFGLTFLAGLGVAAAWGWKASRPVALAVIAWVVFFLPSSNLLFATGTIMAERLAYLPSLGVCLGIGHLGAGLVAGSESRAALARRAAVVALAVLLVVGYSARARARIPDWQSNLTLALADVATSPRSAKLQAGAGMFLAEAGRTDEAEAHLRSALSIYPDYAQMHYNLAVLLARRGAREEAAAHLARAIELAPDNPLPRRLLDQIKK